MWLILLPSLIAGNMTNNHVQMNDTLKYIKKINLLGCNYTPMKTEENGAFMMVDDHAEIRCRRGNTNLPPGQTNIYAGLKSTKSFLKNQTSYILSCQIDVSGFYLHNYDNYYTNRNNSIYSCQYGCYFPQQNLAPNNYVTLVGRSNGFKINIHCNSLSYMPIKAENDTYYIGFASNAVCMVDGTYQLEWDHPNNNGSATIIGGCAEGCVYSSANTLLNKYIPPYTTSFKSDICYNYDFNNQPPQSCFWLNTKLYQHQEQTTDINCRNVIKLDNLTYIGENIPYGATCNKTYNNTQFSRWVYSFTNTEPLATNEASMKCFKGCLVNRNIWNIARIVYNSGLNNIEGIPLHEQRHIKCNALYHLSKTIELKCLENGDMERVSKGGICDTCKLIANGSSLQHLHIDFGVLRSLEGTELGIGDILEVPCKKYAVNLRSFIKCVYNVGTNDAVLVGGCQIDYCVFGDSEKIEKNVVYPPFVNTIKLKLNEALTVDCLFGHEIYNSVTNTKHNTTQFTCKLWPTPHLTALACQRSVCSLKAKDLAPQLLHPPKDGKEKLAVELHGEDVEVITLKCMLGESSRKHKCVINKENRPVLVPVDEQCPMKCEMRTMSLLVIIVFSICCLLMLSLAINIAFYYLNFYTLVHIYKAEPPHLSLINHFVMAHVLPKKSGKKNKKKSSTESTESDEESNDTNTK